MFRVGLVFFFGEGGDGNWLQTSLFFLTASTAMGTGRNRMLIRSGVENTSLQWGADLLSKKVSFLNSDFSVYSHSNKVKVVYTHIHSKQILLQHPGTSI